MSRPVNVDGYWNVRSFVTYGLPVGFIKSNLNLNVNANYVRTPGLINDDTNFANNTTLGLGVVLSSNIGEKVDFTLSSRSSVNFVENTLQEQLNQEYISQNTDLAVNIIFGPGLVFRTNVAHQLFDGLSDSFNQDFWLWNIGIAKKVFKNQRGEFQLSVFDVLEQNNSISRSVNETFIQDIRTLVLTQYAMLTFTYQLRNFGTPPAQNNGGRGDRPWGRF